MEATSQLYRLRHHTIFFHGFAFDTRSKMSNLGATQNHQLQLLNDWILGKVVLDCRLANRLYFEYHHQQLFL